MTRTHRVFSGLVVLTVIMLVTMTNAQQNGDDTSVPSFTPVSSDRLLNADSEPQNWLMYS